MYLHIRGTTKIRIAGLKTGLEDEGILKSVRRQNNSYCQTILEIFVDLYIRYMLQWYNDIIYTL